MKTVRIQGGLGNQLFCLGLAHSLVDYPLRTTAGMVLLAMCCGLIARAAPFAPGPDGPKSQRAAKSKPR